MKKSTVEYTEASPAVAEAISISAPFSKGEEMELLGPPGTIGHCNSGKVRISILLDRSSIDFYKQQAARNHTHYQTMINGVLKNYAARYAQA
jgi:uncharacterized protein (DUF4415 family)